MIHTHHYHSPQENPCQAVFRLQPEGDLTQSRFEPSSHRIVILPVIVIVIVKVILIFDIST